jgi:hypothetical protein
VISLRLATSGPTKRFQTNEFRPEAPEAGRGGKSSAAQGAQSTADEAKRSLNPEADVMAL